MMMYQSNMAGMNNTILNYKGLCFYQNNVTFVYYTNSIQSYHATAIGVNKILKNSSTRVQQGAATSANRLYKVQCESLHQESHFNEPIKELHREFMPPLEGVVQCAANFVPLSPISFLERAAEVYRDRISIVYGSTNYTWEDTYRRCVKLASSLNRLGISRGDIVATLAPNVPAMVELHFAIPMAGAIICPLNTRLDPNMISSLLKHSEARVLFVDYKLLQIAKEAISLLKLTNAESKPPHLVIISEQDSQCTCSTFDHEYDQYECLVDDGSANFSIVRPNDESDPISLNYTSGTTSKPKGVIYSHRGAYLNSIACVFIHGMRDMPTYLWSVPMFHSNGWCMTWGVAIVGGTNVCLRKINPKIIFDNTVLHKVTHMGGAPTVLTMIVNSLVTDQKRLPHKVEIMTAGAPPPPTVLSKIEKLGFVVSHAYGLTETYGLATSCLSKPEWELLDNEDKGKLKARQGVKHFGVEELDVKDPITMESVKCDGNEIGEIMFRGNTIMRGYFKDSRATKEAFFGGWFRSGDLGVKHQDGYIEVKDRSKDIIISGGENISTIEVESIIYRHDAVLEVAVVARPDDHWGQTPCAFVKLKEGVDHVDEHDIIQYCRDNMPHYMAPKTVIFEELARNATGKIDKFVLREKAKTLGSL